MPVQMETAPLDPIQRTALEVESDWYSTQPHLIGDLADLITRHFKALAFDLSTGAIANATELATLRERVAAAGIEKQAAIAAANTFARRAEKMKASVVCFVDFWKNTRDHFYGIRGDGGHVDMDGETFEEIAEDSGLLEVVEFNRLEHGNLPQAEGFVHGDDIYIETRAAAFDPAAQ